MKVKACVDRMIAEYTSADKMPTVTRLKQFWREWEARVGNVSIESITPAMCRGFRVRMRDRLSKVGADEHAQILKLVLNWAWRNELYSDDAMERIRKSRCLAIATPRPLVEWLTPEELARIESVAKGKIRIVFFIAILTGLRKNSIRSLRWSDIDFIRGTISLVSKGGKNLQLPLSDKLRFILAAWKATPESAYEPGGYVVPSEIGTKYDIDERWPKLCDLAGIERKRFHALRHTFATGFLSATGDIMTLSKLLGHSDISTTQIYAHVLDQGKSRLVDVYSKALDYLMLEAKAQLHMEEEIKKVEVMDPEWRDDEDDDEGVDVRDTA